MLKLHSSHKVNAATACLLDMRHLGKVDNDCTWAVCVFNLCLLTDNPPATQFHVLVLSIQREKCPGSKELMPF